MSTTNGRGAALAGQVLCVLAGPYTACCDRASSNSASSRPLAFPIPPGDRDAKGTRSRRQSSATHRERNFKMGERGGQSGGGLRTGFMMAAGDRYAALQPPARY